MRARIGRQNVRGGGDHRFRPLRTSHGTTRRHLSRTHPTRIGRSLSGRWVKLMRPCNVAALRAASPSQIPSVDHEDSDPQRPAEAPGRIVRGGAVVVDEDVVVAAIAKEGAAEASDVRRRRDPAGRLRVELSECLQRSIFVFRQELDSHLACGLARTIGWAAVPSRREHRRRPEWCTRSREGFQQPGRQHGVDEEADGPFQRHAQEGGCTG